jgi:[ribosomal protein S5]-alanine N-acetyltransferase
MQSLATDGLLLEPLTVAHAEEMFAVLSEPELYRYLDYPPPPSLDHLRNVYAQVEGRRSPDGTQLWLNWVVRPLGQAAVGYVQLTVASHSAWVGFVFSRKHWGRGFATRATRAVLEHASPTYGVASFLATVEAHNERSIGLLGRLGFHEAEQHERERHRLSATELLFVM